MFKGGQPLTFTLFQVEEWRTRWHEVLDRVLAGHEVTITAQDLAHAEQAASAAGGRAAETVFLGADAVTSGAGADLVHATRVARQMVAEFGMSEEVGLLSASPAVGEGAVSGDLQSRIDAAVRSLLTRQMERAEAIVRQHQDAVDALASALVKQLVLEEGEVHSILAHHGVDLPAAAASGGRVAA